MPSFKIVLAYDGTDYVGWQRQANGVSIQGVIEDALRELDGRDVTLLGAGRTDAGVHALGQVAAFTIERALPGDAIGRALNACLPAAIRVLSADEVPPGFHPRFGAREKTYRYRIWNGDVISPFECRYAWHVAGALDAAAMQAAAALLVGQHDFAAFQSTGSETKTTVREMFGSAIRTESAVRTPQSAILAYEVSGTGFLRHMVRTIVGTLIEVGRGKQPVEWITRVVASRDRAMAGPTAPPEGLFLVSVAYGDALAAGS